MENPPSYGTKGLVSILFIYEYTYFWKVYGYFLSTIYNIL